MIAAVEVELDAGGGDGEAEGARAARGRRSAVEAAAGDQGDVAQRHGGEGVAVGVGGDLQRVAFDDRAVEGDAGVGAAGEDERGGGAEDRADAVGGAELDRGAGGGGDGGGGGEDVVGGDLDDAAGRGQGVERRLEVGVVGVGEGDERALGRWAARARRRGRRRRRRSGPGSRVWKVVRTSPASGSGKAMRPSSGSTRTSAAAGSSGGDVVPAGAVVRQVAGLDAGRPGSARRRR